MENPFSPGYYGAAELRQMGFRTVGNGALIAKNCTIVGLENIDIGENARIDGFCTIVATDGSLTLGRHSHIHTSVVLGCRGGILIEDYAGISHGCNLVSASDDLSGRWMTNSTLPPGVTAPKIAPIRVGRHVAMGAGCTVMPGVTIGEGAAIGAMSLVSRDLSEWHIHVGIPARAVRPRERALLALADQLEKARRDVAA